MKPNNAYRQAFYSMIEARVICLAARPMYLNAMRQLPDEAVLPISKYVLCLHDQLVAVGNVIEYAIEHAKNESVIREIHKLMNDVAPQVAADKRKAQLAWIRKVRGCSKIETDAALLKTDGMTLSEIAKRLPYKNGKAMTRQGVQRVLCRFEKNAGQHGLFSTGTYREQEQAKLDEKRIIGGVYWKNAEERNKPDEDSEDASGS